MNIKKIKPLPGQESVWDYPRPPAIEPFKGHLRIVFQGEVIVDTNKAYRILETSHPPSFYLPLADFKPDTIKKIAGSSYCEWKGMAEYFEIEVNGSKAKKCAWGYPNPNDRFAALKGHVSVYAHMMEACFVNDEKVQAQEGDFYGGWITSNIVGPFKGAPGTWGW
ncbi:MAG: hypothetical protein ACJA0X_003301 [Cyclobacteriaceae bacterium]|jgi:uncharacterized protein (DUF427 family)